MRRYDLEDRLILFASNILTFLEYLFSKEPTKVLSKQIARSGTSPALNYREAQAAESDRDFIHKMKICLKELRETQVCLKIVKLKKYLPIEKVDLILDECNQLVAIFVSSISTIKKRMKR